MVGIRLDEEKRLQSTSMLRRLRLGFGQVMRRLGPLLGAAAALTALGLSANAAVDWHLHGSPGAGFFHLHFHIGQHEHNHHHHETGHHENESPEPGSGSEQHRCGTLTMVIGVAPAPPVAVAGKPAPEADDRIQDGIPDLADTGSAVRPWSPRAPPV